MSRFWREFADSTAPTRAAALAAGGVGRGKLAGPHWQRTSRGLYVASAAIPAPVTPTQRIVQAWARLPPEALIGGWAAAYALGVTALDGIHECTFAELPVTAILPAHLHRSSGPQPRYVRDRIAPRQTYTMEGIRWTRELRTTSDLARWAGDLPEAVVAIDAMLAARLITREQLDTAADAWLCGQRGDRQARCAVELGRPRTRSTWETRLRMLYVVELEHPMPLVNQPVFDLRGEFLGAPDLLDVDAGLAIEFDGARHRDREQHRRDNIREERLERARLIVVRVDSEDLRRHRRELRARLSRARAEGLRRNRSHDGWTIDPPRTWTGLPS